MIRSILILCAIVFLWWLLRQLASRYGRLARNKRPRFSATVRCAQCGAYVDRRHAHLQNGKPYCKAHSRETL